MQALTPPAIGGSGLSGHAIHHKTPIKRARSSIVDLTNQRPKRLCVEDDEDLPDTQVLDLSCKEELPEDDSETSEEDSDTEIHELMSQHFQEEAKQWLQDNGQAYFTVAFNLHMKKQQKANLPRSSLKKK